VYTKYKQVFVRVMHVLNDIERKIKKIIWNYTRSTRRMPTYEQLSRFSGRSEGEVRKVVQKLQHKISEEKEINGANFIRHKMNGGK
jgi:hypothetical protein